MGSVYTIYCYFNSEQIQGILNAVVMLVGSGGVDGDYLSLVRVAAIMGMFMAMCYGFLRARGEDAAHYLVMVAIFYSTLFVPRVTVQIEDHGGAGTGDKQPKIDRIHPFLEGTPIDAAPVCSYWRAGPSEKSGRLASAPHGIGAPAPVPASALAHSAAFNSASKPLDNPLVVDYCAHQHALYVRGSACSDRRSHSNKLQ